MSQYHTPHYASCRTHDPWRSLQTVSMTVRGPLVLDCVLHVVPVRPLQDLLHHICCWSVMRRGVIQPAAGHDAPSLPSHGHCTTSEAVIIHRPPCHDASPCQVLCHRRLQRPGFHDLRHCAEQLRFYSRAKLESRLCHHDSVGEPKAQRLPLNHPHCIPCH